MRLFHFPTSPYSRKVRVVLLEKGIACEEVDVAPPTESNPLGKVPTLVLDDGTIVFDSPVITETLEALYPSPRLIPESPIERALVRRWEALADGICDALIPVVYESRRPASQQDPAHLLKLLGKVQSGLSYLDDSLRGRRTVHETTFTLADIAVVSMLGYVNLRRPELLAQRYPELRRYMGEQSERRTFQLTVPPNLPPRS